MSATEYEVESVEWGHPATEVREGTTRITVKGTVERIGAGDRIAYHHASKESPAPSGLDFEKARGVAVLREDFNEAFRAELDRQHREKIAAVEAERDKLSDVIYGPPSEGSRGGIKARCYSAEARIAAVEKERNQWWREAVDSTQRWADAERERDALRALVREAFGEGFNCGIAAGHDLSSQTERDVNKQWERSVVSDSLAALAREGL